MALRNSVIFIGVCMGIERSYKIVQNRGKRFKKRFKAIPVGFREENRKPKTHWNRFETPPNAVETQVIHRRWEGKSILLNLFPLF